MELDGMELKSRAKLRRWFQLAEATSSEARTR